MPGSSGSVDVAGLWKRLGRRSMTRALKNPMITAMMIIMTQTIHDGATETNSGIIIRNIAHFIMGVIGTMERLCP